MPQHLAYAALERYCVSHANDLGAGAIRYLRLGKKPGLSQVQRLVTLVTAALREYTPELHGPAATTWHESGLEAYRSELHTAVLNNMLSPERMEQLLMEARLVDSPSELLRLVVKAWQAREEKQQHRNAA